MIDILKHISVKISLIFFALILVIISGILYMTHNIFNNFFIDYVTDELLRRGHSHAEVLAEHWDSFTLEHVAHMETDAITEVIVINPNRDILAISNQLQIEHLKYLALPIDQSIIDRVVESDWRNQQYIVTKSPVFFDNQLQAIVYMFSPTQPIRDVVAVQFKILLTLWIVSLLIGFVLVYVMSRIITKPLLEMKNATEKISTGRFDFEISAKGYDELADLGNAIDTMAKNLHHYQSSRHEFLSDISHELRTPLTYLKGYSELLMKNEVKNPEEIQHFNKIIYDEANRVQRLVQDLLILSKMDEPSFSMEKKEVDLLKLINETVNKLQPLYGKKNVTLIINEQLDNNHLQSLTIALDEERMAQVFVNLLDNALRYTPSGGSVDISITNSLNLVKITISDAGIGISKNDLPHIWDRLYRVEKSRSRDTGGSGLGLAIVKEIIELHDGEIYVYSEEGKGTTFEIYLSR